MVGFLRGRITLSAPPSLHGEWTVYVLQFRPNGTCNGKQVVAYVYGVYCCLSSNDLQVTFNQKYQKIVKDDKISARANNY